MAVAEPFAFDTSFLAKQIPTPLHEVEAPWEPHFLSYDERQAVSEREATKSITRRAKYGSSWKWSPSAARAALDVAFSLEAEHRAPTKLQRILMGHAVGVDRLVERRDALDRLLQGRGYRRALGLPPPRLPERTKPIRVPLGDHIVPGKFEALERRQIHQLLHDYLEEVEEYVQAVERFWREWGFKLAPDYAAQKAKWREVVPHEVDLLPPNSGPKIITALIGSATERRSARYAAFLLVTEPRGVTPEALTVWMAAVRNPAA